MAYLIINTKTAAELESDNPVLLPNQAAVETDTLLVKVGDGLTEWNDLEYNVPTDACFEQVLSGLPNKVPSSKAVKDYIDSVCCSS